MGSESGLANLSRRIASGSSEAVADLHATWFVRSVGLVRQATGLDEADAMDVVQEALLKAATGMPIFEDDRRAEAWLRRVLVNRARDRLRSEIRRRRREIRSSVTEAVQVDRIAATREEIEHLERRIQGLESAAADLLRRRFVLGWTLERIGRELGIGAGAVDGRIRRAIVALKGGVDDRR